MEMMQPSPEKIRMMKKIGRTISICMGITLSFFLSLSGTLLSGHFTPAGWLISFVVSTAISLVIGCLVPMKLILDRVTAGMKPGSLAAKCVESLISDVVYTPVITLAMVSLAHRIIAANAPAAHVPPFLPMFLHSLGAEMVIGFVLIFIFMPLFMALVMKKYGMPAHLQGAHGPQQEMHDTKQKTSGPQQDTFGGPEAES